MGNNNKNNVQYKKSYILCGQFQSIIIKGTHWQIWSSEAFEIIECHNRTLARRLAPSKAGPRSENKL